MLVVDGRLVLLGVVVFALGSAPLIPIYQGSLLTSLPETAHAKVNSALGITAAAATTVALAGTGVLLDLEVRAPFILAALVLVFLCVQLSAHVRKMATPSSVE
jgi:MFS family permease